MEADIYGSKNPLVKSRPGNYLMAWILENLACITSLFHTRCITKLVNPTRGMMCHLLLSYQHRLSKRYAHLPNQKSRYRPPQRVLAALTGLLGLLLMRLRANETM